jgi:hypothetical protein
MFKGKAKSLRELLSDAPQALLSTLDEAGKAYQGQTL